MATILLHKKHNGHQPSTDTNKLFILVHPIFLSLFMKNLKRMISTFTVTLAPKNEERKIISMVGGLERVIFLFYLIVKEVEQMIYSMKLNNMLHYLFFIFCKLLRIMVFILIQVLIWFY